jgi:hypothetical protein
MEARGLATRPVAENQAASASLNKGNKDAAGKRPSNHCHTIPTIIPTPTRNGHRSDIQERSKESRHRRKGNTGMCRTTSLFLSGQR